MSTLICGSIAFDNIMQFNGEFAESFLPSQLHNINVAFLVPTMRREFGGCAGNIAYALKNLGSEPVIMATVGDDAQPYLDRLDALKLGRDCVRQVAGSYTAQAFITTDAKNNQITAFHPGAMGFSHQNHVVDAKGVKLAIIAPDGRDGMLQHAQECVAAGVPFVFDPGQGLPMFNGAELLNFVQQASYVAVNEYEAQMLCERTGKTLAEIASMVQALIVTLGANGAQIYAGGTVHQIPSVKPTQIVDPTGCGDAFRGGLLFGMERGLDWPTCGRIASLMGALKIAHQGGQNYSVNLSDVKTKFKAEFGYEF